MSNKTKEYIINLIYNIVVVTTFATVNYTYAYISHIYPHDWFTTTYRYIIESLTLTYNMNLKLLKNYLVDTIPFPENHTYNQTETNSILDKEKNYIHINIGNVNGSSFKTNLIFTYKNIFLFFLFFYFLVIIFIIPYSTLLGLYGVFYTSIISLSFFNTIFLTFSIFLKNSDTIVNFIIINSWLLLNNIICIPLAFKIDYIAASFAALTINIGFFSILYTFSYFREEPQVYKLILLIHLFIISMLLFLFSSNLAVLFLGWELIGITSFLLINFWINKGGTLKASFKAFFFNKWSDLFIILFISLIYIHFGSIEIDVFLTELWVTNKNKPELIKYSDFIVNFYNSFFYNIKKKKELMLLEHLIDISNTLLLLLIFGGSIKSAQFFFHLWLPDSMEAPVPASALIHSATLVSAGVYLLIRFGELLHMSSSIDSRYVCLWGSITALYGGICACNQNDLKKVLAYSTISHCGNMFLLSSIGLNDLVILYLTIHGYFKAFSFLSVGNIIRIFNNLQDLRKIGMLSYYCTLDVLFLTIALLNLGGLPITIGFYLKHYLLMFISIKDGVISIISSICILGTAATGFLYMLKIIHHIFFDFKKGDINIYCKLEKDNLTSKFYSSGSNTLNFLILAGFIIIYIHIFYLISINEAPLNSNGEKFDKKNLIHKNINPLPEVNLINNYKILLIFILFLLLDINYKLNWRFIITEKKGNLFIYSSLISINFILIDLVNLFYFLNSLFNYVYILI